MILKIVLSIIVFILTFAPTEFWFFMKLMLNPTGFWQKLLFIGAGFYFLGIIQIVMLVIGIAAIVAIWGIE
jgi:hypothetical protein